MLKFIAMMLLAIATTIPTLYSWAFYTGQVKEDDKKLANNVYKIENISLDSIEQKLKDTEKFDLDTYK